MRKGLFICCNLTAFILMYSFPVKAQLYVDIAGHTAIGDWQNTDALLNVKPYTQSFLSNLVSLESESTSCALKIYNHTPPSILGSNNVVGAEIFCLVQPYRDNIGIRSYALAGDALSTGSSYGILSKAGYACNGWNYGICTSLLGPHDGAGIFSTVISYPDGYQISGQWAGYFNGNVKVVGSLTANTITQTSDYRLKNNIRQLENDNLSKLMDLNVVKFNLKNYEINLGDTATVPHYAFDNDNPLLKSEHYGLIAQELKEIYPELVADGPDGYLTVNYIELIPIMIKSIQELNAKINNLENPSSKAPLRNNGETADESHSDLISTVLYQNNPNPFTENTIIRCFIPKEVLSATLYIYDMNGHQIDSYTVSERGNVSLTIEGNSLDAGIYLYSLITDGTVVDTKRMILTK